MGTIFDIRAAQGKILHMCPPKGHLSFAALATVYPVTRGRLCQLAAIHGRAALSDPARLAKAIKDRRLTLVDFLSVPSEVRRIKSEIKALTTKA